ncbi:MAG: hypothetical protein ACM3X0_13465 [Bacteroidota bacterium]
MEFHVLQSPFEIGYFADAGLPPFRRVAALDAVAWRPGFLSPVVAGALVLLLDALLLIWHFAVIPDGRFLMFAARAKNTPGADICHVLTRMTFGAVIDSPGAPVAVVTTIARQRR